MPTGKHVPYEKIIECEGYPPIVLETHVSKDRSKTPSEGRSRAILAHQLRVSEETFYAVLRSGDPVDRPCPPPPVAVEGLPGSLVHQLKQELYLTDEALVGMDKAEAVRLLQEKRMKG